MSQARRGASNFHQLNYLTPEEYASILDQGITLEIIPNDIRVWDRYLFSKCTTAEQAWRLVQIYVMLKLVNVDYRTVGQWCDQGNFVEKALKKVKESPSIAEVLAMVDLKPIEQNRAAFSVPRSPSVQRVIAPHEASAIQKKWLEQAMLCAQNRLTGPDRDKLEYQKAHFALGMIVFQLRPWAEYLWVDRSLDIWYDIGFPVVFDPDGPKYLQDMYETFFRKDFGIPSQSFEVFYGHWSHGTFAHTFQKWIHTNETCLRKFKTWVTLNQYQSLKGFLKARAENREESVWRLRQMLAVPETKENFLGPGKELFNAWRDYGICPGDWAYQRAIQNEFTTDAYTDKRRKLYKDLLNAKKNPQALHQAMEANLIRVYMQENLRVSAEDVVFLP